MPNICAGPFKGRPSRDLDEDLVHLSEYGQKNGPYRSLSRRLAQYFKTRPFPFKLKYFCRGDMREDEVDNKSWLYLLEYKPTHVFIHVGGNDISSTRETDDVFSANQGLGAGAMETQRGGDGWGSDAPFMVSGQGSYV